MNLEKLKIDRIIGELNMSNGNEFRGIAELVKWFSEMQKQGAESLRWYGQSYQGEVSPLICVAYVTRLESDEEYKYRMEKHRLSKERILKAEEKIERAHYEKLKAKFEK